MNITVRKLYDQLINIPQLKQEIHSTYAESITEEVKKQSPVETGNLQQSWYSERVDEDNTQISNSAEHITYLLGTGLWGPSQRLLYRREPYLWRADHYAAHRCPIVRGINPNKIAIRIDRSGLKCHTETQWDESHKVEWYNFPLNIQTGIESGDKIAVRRLS